MPRGQHPNSLANLKKGNHFGDSSDTLSNQAREKAKKANAARKTIAEEMRALMNEPTKDGSTRGKVLAAKLILNMDKSPEWYKLGLRMMNQLPPEHFDLTHHGGDAEIVIGGDGREDTD